MVATETVGPFDGTPWAQDQWYRYAAAWAPSGVIDGPAATPSAGGLGLSFSGLTPTIAAGRAWVRGAGYELAGGSKTLAAIAANTNASLSRIDRLVLRRDLAAKTVTLTPLLGTPASSPAPPALTQVENGQWDQPLFSFTVPPNSGTTISNVTDERLWVDAGGRGLLGPSVSGQFQRTDSTSTLNPATTTNLTAQVSSTSKGSGWTTYNPGNCVGYQNSTPGLYLLSFNLRTAGDGGRWEELLGIIGGATIALADGGPAAAFGGLSGMYPIEAPTGIQFGFQYATSAANAGSIRTGSYWSCRWVAPL